MDADKTSSNPTGSILLQETYLRSESDSAWCIIPLLASLVVGRRQIEQVQIISQHRYFCKHTVLVNFPISVLEF